MDGKRGGSRFAGVLIGAGPSQSRSASQALVKERPAPDGCVGLVRALGGSPRGDTGRNRALCGWRQWGGRGVCLRRVVVRLMARCRQLVAGRLIGRPDHWNEPDCNPTGYRRSDNGSAAAFVPGATRLGALRMRGVCCTYVADQRSAVNASVIDQFAG